eukprot:9951351-Prorocentrum_lima.AAC.1
MTSSLVGSEMCIRDSRRPTTPCHGRLDGIRGGSHGLKRTSQLATLWVRTCLLYTSDAADDM